MKVLLSIACFAGAFPLVAANAVVDLYETLKDGVASDPWSTSSATTYTLSNDLTIHKDGKVAALRFPNYGYNGTVMDFSEGNHTLTVSGVSTWGTQNHKLGFKGGVWDISNGIFYGAGSWVNLNYTGVELTFDGTVISNASQIICQSGYGKGYKWLAKNGTRFSLTNYMIFRQPNSDSGRSVDDWSLLEFTGGTKIYSGNLYNNRDQDCGLLQNCTIRLSGTDTEAVGTSYFYAGRKSAGYRTEIIDGARVYYQRWYLGSESVNARSNTIYVANGGTLQSKYESYIGNFSGAGWNAVVIDDGGILSVDATDPIQVGYVSAFNSLVLTNGAIHARYVRVGEGVDASNNVFSVSGPDATVDFTGGWNWVAFGKGHDCAVIIEDGADVGTFTGSAFHMTSGNSSTNNSFVIDSGASFTTRYFYLGSVDGSDVPQNSVGNRLFVGRDASLNVYDFNMSVGHDNAIVISNGVVNYTGDYGFWVSGADFARVGRRNSCVLRGTSPRVRCSGANRRMTSIRAGGRLEFDLSELSGPYAEPPFDVMGFEMNSDTELAFSGIETMRERLDGNADIVLARVASGNKISIDASVLAAAVASLPDRASLFLSEDKTELHLKVKGPKAGCVLMVR